MPNAKHTGRSFYMKNKKILVWILAIALIVLLIPVPMRLKDGGTVVYKSVLYSIEDVHRLNPDMESVAQYSEGTVIKILGMEIFNNVD